MDSRSGDAIVQKFEPCLSEMHRAINPRKGKKLVRKRGDATLRLFSLQIDFLSNIFLLYLLLRDITTVCFRNILEFVFRNIRCYRRVIVQLFNFLLYDAYNSIATF